MVTRLPAGSVLPAMLSALLAVSVLIPASIAPSITSAANCQFILGFKTIHDALPDAVGDCKVDEHHNPENGDGLQETTGVSNKGGLLVWRKADNWTAYTDGYWTWVNGPNGLQKRLNTERFKFEADDRSTTPTAPPAATPTPAPHYDYYVETSSVLLDVRPGGAQTFCARLTGQGAPPVFGATARLRIFDHDYTATTLAPDRNACVTVGVPVGAQGCSISAVINYNGVDIAEPGYAHHEWCHVLPF